MSATMNLYKILPNVEYKGYYMDYLRNGDFVLENDGFYPFERKEKEMGAPVKADGHIPTCEDVEYDEYKNWIAKQESLAWSDGIKHTIFSLSYLKSIYGNYRGFKHMKDRLNGFAFKYFNNGRYIDKYLAVDSVMYAQGWFFTDKFFKKEMTFVICTTKEQMINFFNRYIDRAIMKKRYPYMIEENTIQNFIDTWEDGMIFKASW